ncbi:MAG: LytR C-terminal domain-containing protein [Endomicrobium sp.]|nr:LytR C-terminal domain-containing protein [Endomicrobium sp.]
MLPDRLDAYTVSYDRQTNILKVLSVNTDVVVFKARGKTKSLRTIFNENIKKDISIAIKNFYTDLYKLIGHTATPDFYINTSFETLDTVMRHNVKFKSIIEKSNFANKDLESLNRMDITEYVLHLIPHAITKIYKNYSFLDTNIPRLSLIYSVFRFKFLKPTLMFCEMPVKYTKTRVEPDKQNIEEFLNKVYYANSFMQTNARDVLIDVKSSSRKPRMAEKATWLLRANGFDVLDWGNSKIIYDKTLVKTYRGDFDQALKIAKVLKNGKIIVSYDSKVYADIEVFIGEDCIIYDDLDNKKGGGNVKN